MFVLNNKMLMLIYQIRRIDSPTDEEKRKSWCTKMSDETYLLSCNQLKFTLDEARRE